MIYLQWVAHDWAKRCFGQEHVEDKPTRALRLVEEVIELCQSLNIDPLQLKELVNNVYDRPRNPRWTEELGGVALTVAVLCEETGNSFEHVLFTETLKVLAKPTEHFTERNKLKMVARVITPPPEPKF